MFKTGSYNIRSFFELICRYRYCTSNFSQGCVSGSSAAMVGHGYSNQQGLQLISAHNTGKWRNNILLKEDKIRPQVPGPPRVNFPRWARWVLGFLSLLLPFWRQKLEKLNRIEGEAKIVVEEVENAAEVVEKVAMAVAKVSAKVAEKLPENGKLNDTALLLERVSKATAHDAHLTKDIIHKVGALKDDFDDLETMVEPVIEKLLQQKCNRK